MTGPAAHFALFDPSLKNLSIFSSMGSFMKEREKCAKCAIPESKTKA